jgi:hypothetical protein
MRRARRGPARSAVSTTKQVGRCVWRVRAACVGAAGRRRAQIGDKRTGPGRDTDGGPGSAQSQNEEQARDAPLTGAGLRCRTARASLPAAAGHGTRIPAIGFGRRRCSLAPVGLLPPPARALPPAPALPLSCPARRTPRRPPIIGRRRHCSRSRRDTRSRRRSTPRPTRASRPPLGSAPDTTAASVR